MIPGMKSTSRWSSTVTCDWLIDMQMRKPHTVRALDLETAMYLWKVKKTTLAAFSAFEMHGKGRLV